MKDMSKGAKTVLAAAAALAAIVAVLLLSTSRTAKEPEPAEAQAGVAGAKAGQRTQRSTKRIAARPRRIAAAETASEDVGTDDEEQESAEPEEQQSEADVFDAVVDRWMEPSEKGVTMDDVDAFAAAFRAVPEEQRDDCIRRALNLIPDENALLLAGVLMDKSQDKEIVETVFNDVLNRAEEVKMPMLRQIFKDRSHPCWADTAWVFDATGETTAE